jgi:hypothetical protein
MDMAGIPVEVINESASKDAERMRNEIQGRQTA